MKREKTFICLAGIVICVLLFNQGCEEPVHDKSVLALKYAVNDSATYKVETELHQILTYEGDIKDNPNFKGGHDVSIVETTFTQETESIADNGNIIAKITINAIKYKSILKDEMVMDFDSAKDSGALTKLIGKSYKIEIAPDGKLIRIMDNKGIEKAVTDDSVDNKRAQAFLANKSIEQRHGILILPGSKENLLSAGDDWSNENSFNFPLFGLSRYERIYTVKEIEKKNDQQIAVVEMNAIPTTGAIETLQQEEKFNAISNMFDITQTYNGQLKLNLSTGKVEKYSEKLDAEWVFIDPSMSEKKDSAVTSIRMGAIRSYSIEKID